ncbi:MAG TPA: hypothetical protein VFX59_24140 [Polyangiales bacterium]|nr:hypothetical protein [Polyangiales bacterium]
MLALTCSAQARAQACHAPDIRDRHDRELPFRATLAALAATYDRDGYEGNYQGLYGTFAYNAAWWGAEVMLPVYRLDRRSGTEYGLGDMMVTARAALYRTREGDLELGAELPVMLPTGDAERELGMGNVMPMPDLYFSLHLHPLVLRAQAGYGRMIGEHHMPASHEHHHAGGHMESRSPTVNPMNMSELEHALLLGLGLRRELSVHLRWWGAVPVADSMGVLRQALALGANASWEWFDLTLEVQRTLVGGAFEWRELLQLGAIF